MRSPTRAALVGAAVAALVTLPGLGLGTLWDNSETAYGEVAREILLTHRLGRHASGRAPLVHPAPALLLARRGVRGPARSDVAGDAPALGARDHRHGRGYGVRRRAPRWGAGRRVCRGRPVVQPDAGGYRPSRHHGRAAQRGRDDGDLLVLRGSGDRALALRDLRRNRGGARISCQGPGRAGRRRAGDRPVC